MTVISISENIKKRRIQLGMSQQELADKLGYRTRSTITKIEVGENNVPESKLAKYAKVLNTSVEFLKTGTAEPLKCADSNQEGVKTIAIILAGGKSTRNQQNVPNQFINVLGKPVIMYVLEAYQHHPAIDDIYVVCLDGWESIIRAYAKQYGIQKLKGIIPAGETGVLSVRNGLDVLDCNDNDIIVLQESTRPLITEEIISKLLRSCSGAAAICEPMDDRVIFLLKDKFEYVDRTKLYGLQSPEAYTFSMLRGVFKKADSEKHELVETCLSLLMYNLGYELNLIEGNRNNIKVVQQEDIAILASLLKSRI